MINDRIFKPFNPVEDAEEYQAFIRELGKEEDCSNRKFSKMRKYQFRIETCADTDRKQK